MVTFRKILFPTDFNTSEACILSHALRLAGRHRGEVLVQHVVNDDFERFIHSQIATDVGELQNHIEIAAANDMKEFVSPYDGGDVSIRPVLSKGKTAEQICVLAQQEQVDLIVMVPAEAAVTRKVVRLSSRPVLAFPSCAKADNFEVRKILVTTDLSDHSRKVLPYAFELRELFGASLYVLYVIETTRALEFAVTHGRLAHPVDKMREWALEQIHGMMPAEFAGDPRVTLLVERGSPSQQISTVAKNIEADMIIVGKHQHGSTHDHLLGTTTARVLGHSEKPVLTLKL